MILDMFYHQYSVNRFESKEIRRKNVCLFLVGLFSYTSIRIIGMIGISELFLVVFSPFVFFRDAGRMRNEGTLLLSVLSLLWLFGAILADWMAKTPFEIAIRGVAFPVVTFASITSIASLVRNNLAGMKYLILGMFFSSIISIFAFQSHVMGGYESGTAEAIQAVMEYKLFWPLLISGIATLPIQVWYFSTPNWYALLVTLICAFVNLFFGGRSLFLIGFTSFFLLCAVMKNANKIRSLKNKILLFLLIFAAVGFITSHIYKMAIKKGFLGEYEERKYLSQTERGEGMMSLLLSGRSDFFVSLFAALDRPVIGWGSHALDEKGYLIEFARKYGTDKGVEDALRLSEIMGGTPRLPMHSHLTGFWCWHGIFGGLFWLYAIYIVVKGLIKGASNYPASFGYLSVAIPFQVWTMLFSPYSRRIPESALMVFCVMILNINRQKIYK